MKLPVPKWEETDDLSDPCPYCVQWFTPEEWAHIETDDPDDSWDMSRHSPYLPSGPVARMCRQVHEECAQAVADYQAYHQDDLV